MLLSCLQYDTIRCSLQTVCIQFRCVPVVLVIFSIFTGFAPLRFDAADWKGGEKRAFHHFPHFGKLPFSPFEGSLSFASIWEYSPHITSFFDFTRASSISFPIFIVLIWISSIPSHHIQINRRNAISSGAGWIIRWWCSGKLFCTRCCGIFNLGHHHHHLMWYEWIFRVMLSGTRRRR